MPDKIRNLDTLTSHGCAESRGIVLEITRRMLEKADGYHRIKTMMRREGSRLIIGGRSWDLSKKRHIYLIGAGKACNAMAMAVEEILGEYLTRGIVIVKISEDTDRFERTEVHVGGHPLPNASGVEGCRRILEMVDGANEQDLFIAVMSGGSTALMACPVEGVPLEDKIAVTDIMLKGGCRVEEINWVRRHLSRMNGGQLGKRIDAKGAELICLSIYDEVGFPPTGDVTVPVDFHGTPVGPDSSTFAQALQAIADYGLEERLPASVMRHLRSAGPQDETPKAFPRFTYYILNTVPDSCRYAMEAAEELGINAMVLTTFLEGDSRSMGTFMAGIAREIQQSGLPIKPPCVILTSGETTTYIPDSSVIRGHGGPSHELVASFAITAARAPGACMLSIDSEGTDGTTIAAGGITDSATLQAAQASGIDLMQALREHSSGEALSALGDQVITGNTGTNLCDFNILYVPKPPAAPMD